MKILNLILFSAVLGIIFLNLVNAEVSASVNVFYAEIQEDGSVIYTDTPVTDFQTLGYVCLDSDCSDVGEKITGLTKDSSGNSVSLEFPTILENSNGYGIWFYKPGYISWEQKADFYGDYVVEEPLNIYLAKKKNGWAPIMNMHVINEIHPNIPVEVGVEVGIDADSYSALENAGPLKYNPTELELINIVETKVQLKIKDSSENIIYTEEKILNIPYSEFKEISFTYDGFSESGKYDIELSTEITDEKILEPLSQTAKTEIHVIPLGLVDYSFSLIGGLSMSPASPEKNENVNFSFYYESTYVNEFGVLNPLDTNVSIKIYQNETEISNENLIQPNSENYFEFSENFSEAGNYRVVVEGMPAICLGANGCLSFLQEISFVINENYPNDTIAPKIEILSPIDGKTYDSLNVLLKLSTDENAESWFNLNSGANFSLGTGTSFEYNLVCSEGGNILNVYAKDSSNNLRSVLINFIVDLPEDDEDEEHGSNGVKKILYEELQEISNLPTEFIDEFPLEINLSLKKSGFSWIGILSIILLIIFLILILIIARLIYKKK